MGSGDADESATVAERPGAKNQDSTVVLPTGTGAAGATIGDAPPTIADRPQAIAPGSLPAPTTGPGSTSSGERSLTTAADALRDEEVERTRLFIKMGWGISIAAVGAVPMLPAPLWSQISMVAAMLLGVVVSFFYHRRFADPTKFSDRALLELSVLSIVNAHVAVMYFGAFTISPLIVVVGIHFVARTEAVRVARWIFATAMVCYGALAIPIVCGIADPGVFATAKHLSLTTRTIGASFVLGTYLLAYVTARQFRKASIASIDDLAKQTRLASQREALMEELRIDLERALRVGGPGRYTDQQIGSFKLGVVLGRGAMGEVYEAVHAKTSEPAAVKLLRREILADSTQVARFLREARTGGSLSSPYVVRVLEAADPSAFEGAVPSTELSALPYLAMEKLHGTTLAETLRRNARLPVAEVIELARQVGAGLDAAAAAGIVHRDLKPQNLMRAGDLWKILDFGAATLLDDTGHLTQGGIVGTPSYMAPEQAQGKSVDARADLYALAAVAYRCLTGRHPFTGPDTPALLYAVVHRMPAKPSSVAELDHDVDAVLAIGLAKSPADRFPSGEAFATALEAAIAGNLDTVYKRRADSLVRRNPWD